MFTQRSTRAPVLAALTVAALATATACGNEKAHGPQSGSGSGSVKIAGASVGGVHWSVRSVTADGTTTKAPGGAYVEFVSDGRVRGNYGCNHFDAHARLAGDTVDLGRTSVTEMYCADQKQRAFEKTLAHALAAENRVTAHGSDRLTLTGADGATVDLVKEKDSALVGTKWDVTGLSADDVTRSLPKAAEGRARLVFTKDGRVDARLGCNSGSAPATVKDGHITFGALTSTKMGCVGEAADVEKRMRAVLHGTTGYDIQGDSLTLTAADGTGITLSAGR
ncbi:META domain-containing protein [Streptomyces sp. VRA16 Mangrove soil]|uniref:META domain-containing protein n=1 Tax=Streptomyces sp. VRA16 Mangrove soil TaxID=2817434 RepID=UPI001A9D8F9C|nr:META domain-containing protein [Streptomyces sp. VRA16 Mangrove soil]MBO1337358.1 META domain-containing protein [Streptomyces sp. VRA16 Mangrove soil]